MKKTPKKKKDIKELCALWKCRVPLAVNDLGHNTFRVEDEEMADDFDLCISGEKIEGRSNPLVPSVAIQTPILSYVSRSCLIYLLPTDFYLRGCGPQQPKLACKLLQIVFY